MKNISSRLAAAEKNPQIVAAKHRQELITRAETAIGSDTFDGFLQTLEDDKDLSILQRHYDDIYPDGIEWGAVSSEDLEAASMNKISTKELRSKYPSKEGTAP